MKNLSEVSRSRGMRMVYAWCNKGVGEIIANTRKAGSKAYDSRPNHFSKERE